MKVLVDGLRSDKDVVLYRRHKVLSHVAVLADSDLLDRKTKASSYSLLQVVAGKTCGGRKHCWSSLHSSFVQANVCWFSAWLGATWSHMAGILSHRMSSVDSSGRVVVIAQRRSEKE